MNDSMTYQIEYLPSALRDLTEIADYIGVKLNNPEAADRLSETIVSTIEKLTEMPYRYPIYSPAASFTVNPLKMEYRKMVVRNYLVFYWVNEEKQHVTIARVIYSGRNIDNILV